MKRETRAIIKRGGGQELELGIIRAGVARSGYYASKSFVEDIDPAWLEDAPLPPRFLGDYGQPLPPHDWMTPNASCLYLDMHLAELSTCLALGPREILKASRAGRLWLDQIRKKYLEEQGKNFQIYCNNVGFDIESPIFWGSLRPQDVERSSWSCHERYTLLRSVPYSKLVGAFLSVLTLRTPIVGAGKVGGDYVEVSGEGKDKRYKKYDVDFQIAQRPDFFITTMSMDTMTCRGIFNTRDTSYANDEYFRCLHATPGDTNMLELSELLKLVIMDITCSMLEDGVWEERFIIQDIVETFHAISWGLDFTFRVRFENRKRTLSVVDCLKELCDIFWKYMEEYRPEETVWREALLWLRWILDALAKKDWDWLFGKLDWVTKRLILEENLVRKGKGWKDGLAYQLDLKYHDNDHSPQGVFHGIIWKRAEKVNVLAKQGKSYQNVCGNRVVVKILEEEEIIAACRPPNSRSHWIFETAKRYNDSLRWLDYWYYMTLTNSPRGPSWWSQLFFDDPRVEWDENLASQLLALPLPKFLQEVVHVPSLPLPPGENGEVNFARVRMIGPDPKRIPRGKVVEEEDDKWHGLVVQEIPIRREQRPPSQMTFAELRELKEKGLLLKPSKSKELQPDPPDKIYYDDEN